MHKAYKTEKLRLVKDTDINWEETAHVAVRGDADGCSHVACAVAL